MRSTNHPLFFRGVHPRNKDPIFSYYDPTMSLIWVHGSLNPLSMPTTNSKRTKNILLLDNEDGYSYILSPSYKELTRRDHKKASTKFFKKCGLIDLSNETLERIKEENRILRLNYFVNDSHAANKRNRKLVGQRAQELLPDFTPYGGRTRFEKLDYADFLQRIPCSLPETEKSKPS